MVLPAEVPLVEIHSKASTSVASVEEEVSPASSKISSEDVAEASSRLMDSVPAILAVLMALPVMVAALLGGEGIIKLSNGSKIKLKIKPETQNGTKVRVRGKGYDRGDGTFGDLMITYNVKLPTGLNEKQKDLLRQMKDAK